MMRNKVLKGAACLAVIGATVGLYFGASHFSRTGHEGEGSASENAGTSGSMGTDAAYVGDEGWEQPDTWPEEADIYGRLQVGDFEMLDDEAAVYASELETAFKNERGHSVYAVTDINQDGRDELVWQIFSENKADARVLAVFAEKTQGRAGLVLFQPLEDEHEYFLLGEDSLLYIRKNEWYISEFHVTKVLFDLNGKEYAGDGISMYLVEDKEAYEENVDPALRNRMFFITGAGVWYQRVPTGKTLEDATVISGEEFDAVFAQMTGLTPAEVCPREEAKRKNTEGSVRAEAELYRRVRYNTPAFDVRVAYPQLIYGDKAQTINAALRATAYAQVLSDEEAESMQEAEAYVSMLSSMQNDYSSGLLAKVDSLVLDDSEAYVSALFAMTTQEDGESSGTKLSLSTYDRASGRQLQLGDVATTADVERAIVSSLCTVMRWEEGHLVKDTLLTQDTDFQRAEFTATYTGCTTWKNIGMDEQYIYIVLHADGADEVLLRVPMWEVGLSSAGHMQLLSMHEAYPVLESILDTYTQVRARKTATGFLIVALTPMQLPVTLVLSEQEEALKYDLTPSAARDYYAKRYEGMTGFQTGLLLFDGEEAGEKLLNFYAVENGRGMAGEVFFEVGENTYCLEYTGRMAQNLPVFAADSFGTGLTYTAGGLMQTDSIYSNTWQDYSDGSRRVEYMVAEDNGEEEPLMYVFNITKDKLTDEEGREKEALLLGIAPADNPYKEVSFKVDMTAQTVLFRDLNGDSYPDLTIGTLNAQDHSDEHNFLYNPRTGNYMQGPQVLETQDTYRLYPAAGMVVVTDASYTEGRRLIRYDWVTSGTGTGTLTRSATLVLKDEQDGGIFVLMTDDTSVQESDAYPEDEERPVLLKLQLADAGTGTEGEPLDVVTDFFLSRTIWEGALQEVPVTKALNADGSLFADENTQAGTSAAGESEEEAPEMTTTFYRILLSTVIRENPVAGLQQAYLYVLDQNGTRIERKALAEGADSPSVTTNGADSKGRFTMPTEEGTEEEQELQILVYYAKEQTDETGEEREPDDRADVISLMKELKLLK